MSAVLNNAIMNHFMQVISDRWSPALAALDSERDWLELRYMLHGAILIAAPDISAELLDDLHLLYYIARDRSMRGVDL